MASQSAEPAAPQTQVVSDTSDNAQARIGTYVDTDLTKRNVAGQTVVTDQPPASGSTTLGGVRPVYAADQATEIENDEAATANAAVTPPPHAPNKWTGRTVNNIFRSRDPYAANGMPDQSYLNNQG